MRVLLYVPCSTEEQTISGAGIRAQRQALGAACERRGWTVVRVITDEGYSAKDMRRPGVQEAVRALEAPSHTHRGSCGPEWIRSDAVRRSLAG